MKRLILLLLITTAFACKKGKLSKDKEYSISVTGNSFQSEWTVNGQTYYGGTIPTVTIKSGQSATYKDAGVNSQKNVSIIVDNNTVWSYNGNGVANYTYTAK